jgi:hypothetical protein
VCEQQGMTPSTRVYDITFPTYSQSDERGRGKYRFLSDRELGGR